MLENTIQNGERPLDLIIYGGTGQAARDWRCLEVIVESLRALRSDETLDHPIRQAGRPVSYTRGRAPRSDSQHPPGWTLGQLGNLPRAQAPRTHHVRSVHGRRMGVHRSAGGLAVDLRDARRVRAPAFQRFAARTPGAHRRSGRYGRRPAAGDQLPGWRRAVVEVDEEHVDRRLDSGYLEHKAHTVQRGPRAVRSGAIAGTLAPSGSWRMPQT